LRLYGMAAHAIPEPVFAADFLARAESRLRQQGRLGLLSHVLTMAILDLAELGDWDQAAMNVEEAQLLAHDTGQPIWDTGTQSLTAILVALRGDAERAHRLASEVEQAARNRNLNDLIACAQLARGISRITEGRHSDAFDELRRLFDHSDQAFHLTERFHGVMFLAEAAIHSGRLAEARAIVTDLELDAATTPSSTLHRQLAYARAVLADDEDAETLYIAGLSQDLTRWPWHRARLELAYGSWLRRHRRSSESRSPLRAARTTLELIGATAWAEQARIELRAAGERTENAEPLALDMLSAQELQIARLAADGLTNREIGEQLFLSHRTVGSHLYRIFPKLGITSRAQLAARLGPKSE
jgi:ATP/maltotriose-dependent transcriptional regulator MalT